MKPKSIAIVGAAETTDLGVIPDMSQIQLHADAALNAMADAGLKPADIDGIATAGETPVTVAHYLGLTPKWVDGTAVGGCSFMIHVRHVAAPITVEDVLNSRNDRLPVPFTAVLPGDRRRRRVDFGFSRARQGLPAKARLPARHR